MNLSIEQHYSRPGLFENILAVLEQTGIDKKKITRNNSFPGTVDGYRFSQLSYYV